MRKPRVRLYLDNRVSLPLNLGAHPVSLEFYFNGKRKYAKIESEKNENQTIYLTPSDFDMILSGAPRSKELKDIKEILERNLHKAKVILEDIKNSFSLEKAKKLFLDSAFQTDKNNLFTGFSDYIKELESKGQIKTSFSYQSSKNSLEKFNKELTYLNVTPTFLEDYERWMLFEKKLSKATLGIYLRSLRTILNKAIKKEILSLKDYPFGKDSYVIPTGRNVKRALTIENIREIRAFFTIPNSPADKAKDFFIFSYLANGINFKDIAQLRNKDLKEQQIHFIRAKTERTKRDYTPIKTALRKETLEIIEKWRGKNTDPDAYLFPILQKDSTPKEKRAKIDLFITSTNAQIKKIGEELKLPIKLTTYVARHSFASIAISKGGARIEEISDALGHSSIITTRNYIDSFDSARMQEITDSLL